jgi:uncharacterized protein (TIGR03000 family)
MYSMVLIMALNGQAAPVVADDVSFRSKHSHVAHDTDANRRRRRGGCHGGCYGGCNGGCYGGGCSGGGYAYGSGYGGGYAGYYGDYGSGYAMPYGGTGYRSGSGYNMPYGSGYYRDGGAERGDYRRDDAEYRRPPTEVPAPRERGADTDRNRDRNRPGAGDRPPASDRPPGDTGAKPPENSAAAERQGDRAYVRVQLPAEAQLFINDAATESTDSARNFYSPPLKAGKDYTYSFRAEMMRDGKKLQATKDVVVQAGKEVDINLNDSDFKPVQ